MEQIRLDGRPEKPKRLQPDIEYRKSDNKVAKVEVFIDGWAADVRLRPDGTIIRPTKTHLEVIGRMPSEQEVPKYVIDKAEAQAVAIYHSHEKAKLIKDKKAVQANEQIDLDFGDESGE